MRQETLGDQAGGRRESRLDLPEASSILEDDRPGDRADRGDVDDTRQAHLFANLDKGQRSLSGGSAFSATRYDTDAGATHGPSTAVCPDCGRTRQIGSQVRPIGWFLYECACGARVEWEHPGGGDGC